jgi:hypothetical protein
VPVCRHVMSVRTESPAERPSSIGITSTSRSWIGSGGSVRWLSLSWRRQTPGTGGGGGGGGGGNASHRSAALALG